MKLLMFYCALLVPIFLLSLFAKQLGPFVFPACLFLYCLYNCYLCRRKLIRKGYRVGWFAHLNPFSRRSSDLYAKVYFEA